MSKTFNLISFNFYTSQQLTISSFLNDPRNMYYILIIHAYNLLTKVINIYFTNASQFKTKTILQNYVVKFLHYGYAGINIFIIAQGKPIQL